jgi:hypothetical protein
VTDPHDRPRLYGDKEVARILERASELHAVEGREGSGRAVGLSLAELEEIAAEAGIPVASVRQAVSELESGAGRGGSHWATGEAPTILLERTLPVEIPMDAFERLAVVIQEAAGMHGQAGLLGRTLTWRADTPDGSRSLQVMVTTRAGQTRIRIEERLHQLAGQLFGGLMGGVGGGLGIGVGLGVGIEVLNSVLFAVAWPLGIVGLSYMTARTIFSTMARRRQRELRTLLERLVEAVEDSGVRPAVERAPEPGSLAPGAPHAASPGAPPGTPPGESMNPSGS